MRISLVGSGIIGSAHAARLDAMERVDELLVADFVEGRAEQLAAALSDKARPVTVEEAFGDVDGVAITAKTSRHAELLHMALHAGLPTFCEKPIAIDLETTRTVVEHAARRPDVVVQIGFQRRFDAGFNRAREACRDGRFGAVEAASYLRGLGPERIGFIGGDDGSPVGKDRRAGWAERMSRRKSRR